MKPRDIYFVNNEDMLTLRRMAANYNMSLSDFLNAVERQASGNLIRWTKVTEEEKKWVEDQARKHGTTITRWCCLAVRSFIQSSKPDTSVLFFSERNYEGKRSKRIQVAVRNKKDDADMLRTALEYNVTVSSLIRFCALRFDGEKVNMEEGSGDNGEN